MITNRIATGSSKKNSQFIVKITPSHFSNLNLSLQFLSNFLIFFNKSLSILYVKSQAIVLHTAIITVAYHIARKLQRVMRNMSHEILRKLMVIRPNWVFQDHSDLGISQLRGNLASAFVNFWTQDGHKQCRWCK